MVFAKVTLNILGKLWSSSRFQICVRIMLWYYRFRVVTFFLTGERCKQKQIVKLRADESEFFLKLLHRLLTNDNLSVLIRS